MEQDNTLILEIAVHDNTLRMGIFPREEYTAPVRHYSERAVSFAEIERLVDDIIHILNKTQKRSLLEESALVEFKKTGQLLYDYLLTRAVKERLFNCVVPNLILSVDEKLVNIPWELLYDGGEFLCLRFNLGRLIRTEAVDFNPHYRSINDTLKMLVLSNPTSDLKSAYEEGLSIKNYLNKKKDKVRVDFKAHNIDRVYIKKNLRDYDIVHYAGHCEYNEDNPALSGWVLSDGVLSAKDFSVMGEISPLPSIIFANTCQSASCPALLGSRVSRNIYSLAQAFLFSGARHYIGTFWKLEDGLALLLAEEFYAQILEGSSLGEALRLARLDLIKQYGLVNIAWANYVLYGDPAFVLFKTKATAITRFKIKSCLFSKKAVTCGLSAALIIAGLLLSKTLPSFKPNTYFLFSQVNQYFLKGNNQEAIDLSNRIIKQDGMFLPAYKMLGDVYFRLGDSVSALRYYFEYARNNEKKNDNKNLAGAYVNIAWVYHMWGDYPKAKEFYDKAIALSTKNRDKLNEADALERLAVWHIDKGDCETAFSLLIKSSEINRSRQHNPEYRFNLACDYFSIGYLYFQKDDYSTAKEFFNKSKEIFKSLKAFPELSDYYFDMGEIALFEKNYNEAQEFYKKGLELDKRLNNRFNLSSDYQMLGELCRDMKRFSEAESYFMEAINICKEINNQPTLAGAYYELAMMYKEMGQLSQARDYFSKALEIYKHIDTPDYQKVHQEYLTLNK